jgi:hypothetical protein
MDKVFVKIYQTTGESIKFLAGVQHLAAWPTPPNLLTVTGQLGILVRYGLSNFS